MIEIMVRMKIFQYLSTTDASLLIKYFCFSKTKEVFRDKFYWVIEIVQGLNILLRCIS